MVFLIFLLLHHPICEELVTFPIITIIKKLAVKIKPTKTPFEISAKYRVCFSDPSNEFLFIIFPGNKEVVQFLAFVSRSHLLVLEVVASGKISLKKSCVYYHCNHWSLGFQPCFKRDFLVRVLYNIREPVVSMLHSKLLRLISITGGYEH